MNPRYLNLWVRVETGELTVFEAFERVGRGRDASIKWRAANSERCTENNHKWDAKNPGRHAELSRKWGATHPGRVAELSRKWYAANTGRARAACRAWREANPERTRALGRKWYAAHPERARAKDRAWRAANPERARELGVRKNHARRARQRGLAFDRTVNVEDVYRLAQGWCAGCGKQMPFEPDSPVVRDRPSIDHIRAVANGGPFTWDNVQLMHRGCNSRKCDR